MLLERAEQSFCGFTGAQDQYLPGADVSAVASGQLNRGRRNRIRVPTQHRVAPNSSAGRQGTRKDQIHVSARCAQLAGDLVCPAYLAKDLRLTQDLRIESGGNPK